MRKLLTIPAAVAGVFLCVSPAAADEGTSVTIGSEECGIATVTFSNPTDFKFFGDFQIGSESGTADDVTGDTIEEGPLENETWGNVFHLTPIAAGSEETVTVEVPVDTPDVNGDGVITVRAWIDRGPEQHFFAPAQSVDVDLCEPESTTPPNPEEPGDDPENPGEEPGEQPGGENPGDEPGNPEKPGDDGDDGDDKRDEGGDNGKGGQPSETDDGVAPVTTPGPTSSAPVTVDAVSANDDLADTGVSGTLTWLVPAGVALLAVGGGTVWLSRRRGEHGA
ncbi:hypothetical protein LY13_004610 [Prauserella aidingensis]|uniref:hypothetical protein n=1 Tax=Prauserella aidingensis TaxID=387890 RepID=UPI0020A23C57|nr:hypothetical protein [Prauserella aidingensis]MCP2255828.1 hypothetical protein [Prauserella aidingensis]